MASFNCKNLKTSVDEIRKLCDNNDIVLLQEIWLTELDIPIISQVSPDFYYKATSAMDMQNGLLIGRPYGGVAIMWRKSFGATANAICYDDSRILGLEFTAKNTKLLILNTYLPCSSCDHLDEFIFYLNKLDSIISTADTHLCMIMGDLNADLQEGVNGNITHLFGRKLLSYCRDEGLLISDHILMDKNSSTFFSASSGTTSWLDHIISTTGMHALIESIHVDQGFISSDHLPIIACLCLDHARVKLENGSAYGHKSIRWDKLSTEELSAYKARTKMKLAEIHINHELMLCDDPNCTNACHTAGIDRLYNDIVDALLSAGEQIEQAQPTASHHIAGWNVYCREIHAIARDAFLAWRHLGSPRSGDAFHMMQKARGQFKRVLRQCKANKDKVAADGLAMKLLAREPKDFWNDVKKMNSNNIKVQATTINGATGSTAICNMWKEHFGELLNSSKDVTKRDCVTAALASLEMDERCSIEVGDIVKAMKELKKGKCKGLDGLTGEHIKYADDNIVIYIKWVFNCMIGHGYLPGKLMDTCLVSLVKDKKEDISNKDNYRPIAITSHFSKLLEIIILHKFGNFLETSDNQFGFKKKHSTDLCVFMLKEIVSFYHAHSGPVFACMLDASKAFDRINHFHLFDKLLARKFPKLIVRLLYTWYRTQTFFVRWDNVLSGGFHVSNGVRQGGVLSPLLFNIFIEDLDCALKDLNVGCYMNNTCFNHLNYADDSVLLAPTPAGLQMLLDVCFEYSLKYDMLYNVRKSKCIHFACAYHVDNRLPRVYLGSQVLKWVDSHSYLGAILTSNFHDDLDIARQIKSIYCRGNSIIHKFRMCNQDVKLELFRAYCSNIYLGQLWCQYKKSSYRKLKVAYNNVFRALLNIPRGNSMSYFYVRTNTDCFDVVMRKSLYSFYKRIMNSSNKLVCTVTSSAYFTSLSKVFKQWNKLLFMYNIEDNSNCSV